MAANHYNTFPLQGHEARVVVLDDEAASFTNDSVVHVEFVTADINGWNVLRKTKL